MRRKKAGDRDIEADIGIDAAPSTATIEVPDTVLLQTQP